MPFRPTSFPSLPGIQRTFLLGLLLLLVPAMAAWSKPADTIRAITGDCLGGADVTVTDESWGQDDSFHCGAAGMLTFGGNISIGEGADVSLSAGTVRIVPPVTIGKGATFRADTAITGSNRAMLGPLAGATIKAYLLTDLNSPIETTTAADLPAGMDVAGRFHLALGGVGSDEWVLVSATGGKDIDFNDDGVLDATPTANQGTIYALAKASDWRSGGVILSALSDMAWRYTENLVNQVAPDELHKRLDSLAQYLIREDLTGDGQITRADLIAFIPNNAQHQAKLSFNYANLFAQDSNNNSLITALHGTDGEEIANQLDRLFGHTLSRHSAADARYTQIKIESALFGKGAIASGDGKIQLDAQQPQQDQPQAWYPIDDSQTVTFTATPAAGNHITGWTGCANVSADLTQCTVPRDRNRSIVTSFAYDEVQLKATLHDLTNAELIIGDSRIVVIIPTTETALRDSLINLQTGDFVVAPSAEGGFFRQVTKFTRTDEWNYTLSTEDAALDGLIAQGTGQITKTLTNGNLVGYTPPTSRSPARVADIAFEGVSGAYLIPSDDPHDTVIRLGYQPTYDRATAGSDDEDYESPFSADDNITIEWNVGMEIELETGVSIGLTGLEYFKFVPHLRAWESMDITATAEVKFEKADMEIGTLTFGKIPFSIGPVPVYVTPSVTVLMSADATISTEMSYGITFEQHIWGGILYQNDNWTFLQGAESSRTVRPFESVVEASVGASLTIRPELKLYDAVGPQLPFTGSLDLQASNDQDSDSDLFKDISCQEGAMSIGLFGGLQGTLTWDLKSDSKIGKILHLDKVEEFAEVELMNESWPLGRWSLPEGACAESPARLEVSGLGINETIVHGEGGILQTTLTLRNTSPGEDIPWAIGYVDDGKLTVTPSSGTLAAGGKTTVTVSLDTSSLDPWPDLAAITGWVPRYQQNLMIWNKLLEEQGVSDKIMGFIFGPEYFGNIAKEVKVYVEPNPANLPAPNITSVVSNAAGQATLEWTYAMEADELPYITLEGFTLYVNTDPENPDTWEIYGGVDDFSQRKATARSLPQGQIVAFQKDAYGPKGIHSPLSNVVTVEIQSGGLPTPQITSATSTNAGEVELQWSFDPGEVPVNFVGYRISGSTTPNSSSDWHILKQIDGLDQTSATLTGLDEGVTYGLRVLAFGDDREVTPWSGIESLVVSDGTVSGPTGKLNDTGQTWGGNYSSGNNTTCTSNIAAPQDCHQGRDALAAAQWHSHKTKTQW